MPAVQQQWQWQQQGFNMSLKGTLTCCRILPSCKWCLCCLRLQLQDAAVKAREDAAAFDTSRLVEFSERLVWEGPAVQLSPLVREPGRLAVTDQRLYFQPLHNIAGATELDVAFAVTRTAYLLACWL
jgi:hypothetical protein